MFLIASLSTNVFFFFFIVQELNVIQLHKDQVQEMRRQHLDATIELQYQQVQSLQEMRDNLLNKQHATEWDQQLSFGTNVQRELKKKHLLELKVYPVSLRVSLTVM